MILQVSVENFKSINKPIVLSMMATNDELHQNYLRLINDYKILPSTIIIGTNGAGKSNLFLSLKYLQDLLLNDTETVKIQPHKLSDKNKPTHIDLHFMIDGVHYAYGIGMLNQNIHHEFLYIYEDEDAHVIFEREKEIYQFNKEEKINGEVNRLYLSVLQEYMNDVQIKKVYDFLVNQIIVISQDEISDEWMMMQAVKAFHDPNVQQIMNELLSHLHIGVEQFYLKDDVVYIKYQQLDLPLTEESTGMKKLFILFVLLSDILTEGKVILFDELEKNLHIELVKYFIYLFNHQKTNQLNSQLIFSTHNASLLNLANFRKDQIWFMEKDLESLTTELYSLYNIESVLDHEDIEKGYLTGKYGATFKFKYQTHGVGHHEE